MPPPKFKRLTIGGEVRLMGAYIVKCTGVDKDAEGKITAIHCDARSGGRLLQSRRRPQGQGHHPPGSALPTASRPRSGLYDKLFTRENMNNLPEGTSYKDFLNPDSVTICTGCKLEMALADAAKPGDKFQFVRNGFFTPGFQESRRL